jgi:ADP-ribose pyrophosphatase
MAVVFKSRVFSVEVERTTFPNGREHEITTVRHRPSIVLLPMTEAGDVILVRQYRASVGRELWELPAGGVEPGESVEDAAVRECEEEIRLVPAHAERLCAFYPAPGFCDELLIFFRLTGLRAPDPHSTRHADADEDIEPRAYTIEAAKALVARGEIQDLKTAYGLSLL